MSREIQVAAIEKEQILEFESYLAAASSKATITERNSLLLSQVRSQYVLTVEAHKSGMCIGDLSNPSSTCAYHFPALK